MLYTPKYSNRFKRQFKKLLRSGNKRVIEALKEQISFLVEGNILPPKFQNHKLAGNLTGYFECHVLPDWLLIYKIDNEILVLELLATGTHSELFG